MSNCMLVAWLRLRRSPWLPFLRKVKLLTVKERCPVYMTDEDRSENRRLTRCGTLSDIAEKLRRKLDCCCDFGGRSL
jgi:hypothetical protein